MNEDVFDSIDAIDAALDKEFGEVANEPELDAEQEINDEEVLDTSSVENTQEEEVEDVEDTSEEVLEPETSEKPEVTDKANKKEYAFANLRAENSSLKKERDNYKSDSDFLKSLAQEYGYDDTDKFQQALKISKYQREAKEKGYDYDLYRKTMEQEERIAQLEREREQSNLERNVERFKTALDKVIDTYEVDEQEVFTRLENAGITVDELLSISNPALLLNGVLSDKIQEKAKQSQISEIKNMKGLVEDKNETGNQGTKVTIESLLKSDLAEYKKNNYL